MSAAAKSTLPGGPEEPLAALRRELSGLELLQGLGDELMDMIVNTCLLFELAAGETLLQAGQTNEKIFVIVRGVLHVYLANSSDAEQQVPWDKPVATLRTGDSVGELSVLDKKPASANVVAHEPTRLLCIDENMFWHIVHASHGFAVRLIIKLSERLRANNDTVQVNRDLAARFEQVALSDALTGVHSRRWLQDTMPRLCDRHRFDNQPLSIAVVDIDYFKRINDTYGHQTGDLVLCEVAKVMRKGLRPTDYIARYGGEEFVLIFPRTSLAGAVVAAERQREAVRATVLKSSDGTELPQTTVSIGVAELQPGQDSDTMIHSADVALYAAKHKGRNRVES
ncbi:MAG TPA: GGDEF domain-containing protein [Polyangiales bacterium]|nr:GGDEF domain-containing protein [Polyangiales bacterium]